MRNEKWETSERKVTYGYVPIPFLGSLFHGIFRFSHFSFLISHFSFLTIVKIVLTDGGSNEFQGIFDSLSQGVQILRHITDVHRNRLISHSAYLAFRQAAKTEQLR